MEYKCLLRVMHAGCRYHGMFSGPYVMVVVTSVPLHSPRDPSRSTVHPWHRFESQDAKVIASALHIDGGWRVFRGVSANSEARWPTRWGTTGRAFQPSVSDPACEHVVFRRVRRPRLCEWSRLLHSNPASHMAKPWYQDAISSERCSILNKRKKTGAIRHPTRYSGAKAKPLNRFAGQQRRL